MTDFDRKVAVITGAASGIGRATAILLAQRGARVHVVDLNGAGADAVAEEIAAAGGTATAHAVDVAAADAVAALADAVHAAEGRVDVLHNNAGIAASGPTETLALDVWRRVVEINVMGVVHGIHAFGPRMLAAGRGHIVNTASAAGLTAVPGLVPYAMSKHAIVGLTESLNAEWSPRGVRVSALCPGLVNTPIATSVAAGAADGQSAKVLRMYECFGAKPEDVATAVVGILERRTLIATVPRAQVLPEWWLRRLHPAWAQPAARLKQRLFNGGSVR